MSLNCFGAGSLCVRKAEILNDVIIGACIRLVKSLIFIVYSTTTPQVPVPNSRCSPTFSKEDREIRSFNIESINTFNHRIKVLPEPMARRIRVALIGETFAGKTALLFRMFEDEFDSDRDPTVTPDFKYKEFSQDGKMTKLECWDTAGQERFASLTTNYLRNITSAVVVYDVCDRQSFDRVQYWVNVYRDVAGDEAPFFLVGNKIDKCSDIVISREEGQKLAEDLGAKKFFETSAKTGKGCDELLEALEDQEPVANFDQVPGGWRCC